MATLRRAESGDRELLGHLLADYLHELDGGTEPYPYFEAYWEEPERTPFLIEAEGAVVGFCLIRVLADGWHFAEFSVLPAERRRGIGRSTVAELAARARTAGASHLEAKVDPDNQRGLAFWLSVGFVVAGRGPNLLVTRRELS